MQLHTGHAPEAYHPHGYCYLWNPTLLHTHLWSDLLIGLSYVVISLALAYLVHRVRRDIPFSVVFVAFGLFIITCGLTHFMEVWTLWEPVFWLSGGVKVVTAAASVATAAAMPFTVPRVLVTVRDARLSRERELAAARADALEESNRILQEQAMELELQREEADALAERLEAANAELRDALAVTDAARAEAQAANQGKSDFLAAMSHELRTPLNAIAGYVDLLSAGVYGTLAPDQEGALDRVRAASRVLLGHIEEVLNFARLEAGAVDYHPRPVAVSGLLAGLEPLITPQVRARGLDYRCDPGPEGLSALCDPDRAQQVLLNLLSNAVKYTPSGGRVSVTARAGGDGRVHVQVSDTGRGIPADKLATIFEPFVQLERHRVESSQVGVGLGLAISRDLAHGMGGDLTVESAPGAGSTFTLVLPRAS